MLLEKAKEYQFFTAASFTSAEILLALELEMLSLVDLLSINLDEAAALITRTVTNQNYEAIINGAFNRLREINPTLSVAITAGKRGSWCMVGQKIKAVPALPVQVVSTAGAGDAFFAGLLSGLIAGLSFHMAQELGTLVAACSVTSPHTIHPTLDGDLLAALIQEIHPHLSNEVHGLIGF